MSNLDKFSTFYFFNTSLTTFPIEEFVFSSILFDSIVSLVSFTTSVTLSLLLSPALFVIVFVVSFVISFFSVFSSSSVTVSVTSVDIAIFKVIYFAYNEALSNTNFEFCITQCDLFSSKKFNKSIVFVYVFSTDFLVADISSFYFAIISDNMLLTMK